MKPNLFSGDYIDRCGELRGDADRVDAAAQHPTTRVVPICGDRCLVRMGRLALLKPDEAGHALDGAEHRTLLGRLDDRFLFAVATPSELSLGPHYEYVPLREASGMLSADEAGLAAYARAMTAWQKRHRHCGVCGSANRLLDGGFVMECSDAGCAHRSFPRLDPAIIVLVTHEARCLLGRQASWPAARFSTIAGFVEPGESLGDAVRREVREETNIEIGECRYLGSQPWPFPAAIMIGFHSTALSTEIACNDNELAEARWISRDDIANGDIVLPPSISIAYRLIETWFDDYDGPSLASLGLPDPPLRVPRPLDQQS